MPPFARRTGASPRGERAGAFLNTVREQIGGNLRNVFALGCQGPDVFYHSQRLRPVALEYGSLLHRLNFGVFSAALLQMALPVSCPAGECQSSTPAHAYALGFMTHAALDRYCHPYIVYKSFDPNAERGSLRKQ